MRNKNTLKRVAYFVYNLLFLFWFYILYSNVYFRCPPGKTATASRLLLGGFAVTVTGIGVAITMRKRRNFLSAYLNNLLPFVLYWLVTYSSSYITLVRIVIALTLMLSVGYFVLSIILYIKAKRKRFCKTPVVKALWLSFLNTRTVAVLCLSLVFLSGIPTIFGLPLLQSTTAAATRQTVTEDFTIANTVDSLVVFDDEAWSKLSNQEKLDALQLVADKVSVHRYPFWRRFLLTEKVW